MSINNSAIAEAGDARRLHPRLRHLLDELGSGVRIIEIAGDPNLGKSRLLNDLREEASRRGRRVLYVRCKESQHSSPLLALTQLAMDQPGMLPEPILRPPVRARYERESMDRFNDAALVWYATRWLRGNGTPKDLTVLLDDLHWADQSSIDFIEQLIRWPAETNLLLVLAHRPRQSSAPLRSALAHGVTMGTVERIELTPLNREESARLLGLPAQDPRLARLHQQAGGNPLYLQVLAHNQGEPGTEIPEQYAALLVDDIDGLPEPQAAVVAAAAVLDGDSDAATLGAVAELDPEQTARAIDGLVTRDLLRPSDESGQAFNLRHPLMRTAIYLNANSGWRWQAHRRARAILARRGAPLAEQARHVERAMIPLDPEDVELVIRTAAEAMRISPIAGIHWLEVALRLFPEHARADRRRLRLALHLARAYWIAGRLAESRDLLHQILLHADDRDKALREPAARFCGMVEWMLGHYAEGRAVLEAELPGRAGGVAINATASGTLNGYVDLPALDPLLPTPERDRMHDAISTAVTGMYQAMQGETEQGHATISVAAAKFDRLSDAELISYPEYMGVLGRAETLIGRLTDARRHFLRGIGLAREHAFSGILTSMLPALSIACLSTGPMDESRRFLAEAAEVSQRIGAVHMRGVSMALDAIATVWTEPENLPRATMLADEAAVLLRPSADRFAKMAPMAQALTAYFAGDHARCMSLILNSGGGPDLHEVPGFLRSMCFEMIAAAGAAAGRDVSSWADEAEAAESGNLPHQRGYVVAARGHALLAAGNHAGAAARYEEAADLFGAAGSTRPRAWTLVAAAHSAAATGRRHDATMMLITAKELATRCGSARIHRRAEEEQQLLATVQGPGALHTSAALSVLTGREHQIAVIAASGKKTREIAQELSLSPRTIDVHLTRIYRKLNISSRAALARLITELSRSYPL